MSFIDRLNNVIDKKNSLLCVGIDPVLEKLPEEFQSQKDPLFAFSKYIIDQTHEYVVSYKPNSAFYEALGSSGIEQLHNACRYIKETYPETLILLDAKRADIGTTNEAYAKYAFDYMGADAITLHPYLGQEAVQPFLDRTEKGSIILCRTSNPGAGEFQDLVIEGKSLYQRVAQGVSEKWNTNRNCMLVVGATYPEELREIRTIVDDMPILVPGIGAQGGDLQKTLEAGLTHDKKGLLISITRSIIYAGNPGQEAQKMMQDINNLR